MKITLRELTLTSLRARLLLLLLSATLLLWAVTAFLSYREAHHEIDEIFDAQLARSAHILLAQVGHEAAETEIEYGEDFHKYERKIVFQVWDADGRLILRSANAPEKALVDEDEGFEDTRIAGRTWRVFSHWDEEHRLLVQVGERHDVRDELTESVVTHLFYPFVFAAPLLALLIWLGVGRGLAPLRGIAAEVANRAPQYLTPLELGGAPDEIRPLVESLNGLLVRLDMALENERRFTADAAHELRTPLAALKTQAQVAQRSVAEDERHHALQQIVEGVDRATHLVEQLLTLARLDPERGLPHAAILALRPIVVECAAALAPSALEKSVELSVMEGDGEVRGDAAMLGVLLRNLIDNAIRYTPGGGWVKAEIRHEAARVVVEVCDSGPGIPPAEREQVLRRFYRVLGSGVDGSGLGLSIVQRIAELHNATVELGESEAGGLAVRVRFAVN